MQALYNKVTYNYSVLDNYIQEKITNDTIITLTLRQMEENKEYEKNCYIDDKYDTGLETCDWIFSNTLFDSYAKKLFGPMVNYDITKYNGAGNGCDYYIYDSKINKLISSSGTGCAFAEEILTTADYAYQTEEKIVIIEKSLYVTQGGCSEIANYCEIYNYDFSTGVYNNVLEGKQIRSDINFDFNDESYLNTYSAFVTYYAYTFTKAKDWNYYYTDFSRLN